MKVLKMPIREVKHSCQYLIFQFKQKWNISCEFKKTKKKKHSAFVGPISAGGKFKNQKGDEKFSKNKYKKMEI